MRIRIRIVQGVLVLLRQSKVLAISLVVSLLCSAPLLAGCGSAGSEEYRSQVTELNEAAAGKLEEVSHLLSDAGSVNGEERVEEVVSTLEEASASLQEILLELEEVKVPAGMEDFHRELIAFYEAGLATFEGCLAALRPGEEHGGDEGHDEPESDEGHEEEGEDAHGGETGQEEDADEGGH